jgi:hypothetical protein
MSNALVKAPTSGPSVNNTSFKWCSFMLISLFYAYQRHECYISCKAATEMLRLMKVSVQKT